MKHASFVFALGLCSSAGAFAQVGHPPPPHFDGMGPGRDSVWVLAGQFNVEGRLVKGAPFSAQMTSSSIQTLADGNRIVVNNTAALVRDSEGRTRREQTVKAVGEWTTGQNAPTMVFIHDPVAQVSYVLEPSTRKAHKTSLAHGDAASLESNLKKKLEAEAAAQGEWRVLHSGSQAAGARHKMAAEGTRPDVATESLGTKVIEGVPVQGRKVTRTIPAGQIGNERPMVITDEIWTSAELHATVLSRHSDPQSGETTYALTNIQRSEPDPTLFAIPSDYTVTDRRPARSGAHR